MLVLYLISIVTTVECGLFNLASRHRSSEPLWQQLKALERINSFLKDVQEEIKESRDLLKKINLKNFNSNHSITDLRHDRKPSVIPKLYPNRYFSMVKSDILKKDISTSSSTLSRTTEITSLPTLFIRQGPDIHASVIPDIESDYGEMLPYFRHEGRHSHRHSKVNKKKLSDKKPHRHVNKSKPDSKRKAGILLKAPSYRPIMAVEEYVKLQKDIDEIPTFDDENHNRHSITNTLESNTAYMTETIRYNRFRNFGQKRFNIVTQKKENRSQYNSQKHSTRRTTKFTDFKLVKRPSVNFKNSDAEKHTINKRAKLDSKHTPAKTTRTPKNKHLRKIIESSSYSDEETALFVNLMDQFYHYNKTNKQNTENKVL